MLLTNEREKKRSNSLVDNYSDILLQDVIANSNDDGDNSVIDDVNKQTSGNSTNESVASINSKYSSSLYAQKKRREEIKVDYNAPINLNPALYEMSQSSLDGCMFDLNNLLAVENNINKGRFISRDESFNKAPDTQNTFWEEITVDIPDDLKISTTASKRERNITNNILDENISKVKSKGNEIFHNIHARSLVEELD